MIPDILQRLHAREHLSAEQAEALMDALMEGQLTDAQIGGVLVGLSMKGETVDELTGCARAMRKRLTPVEAHRRPLVDTCGTGGDRSGTFNISTTAAFVVAGAGLAVAKHGNRSASSRSGSAEVLQALGVSIDMGPEAAARAIDEVGIGFLFAPRYHGSMRYAAGPRRELGVRTLFNLVGPLTNPAGADVQVVGVPRREFLPLVAGALARLGTRSAWVVHGAGGIDELSLAGESWVVEIREGRLLERTVIPEDAGLGRADLEAVRGGDPAENAAITRAVLAGERGPRRDIVLLNAAAALVAAGVAADLREGVARAAEAIDRGQASRSLEALAALGSGA